MTSEYHPLYRHTWQASELLSRYLPRHSRPNKALLLDLALDHASPPSGEVTLSRWPSLALPSDLSTPREKVQIWAVPGHFLYGPDKPGISMSWHLNFAGMHAFSTWRTPLFAQDEIQVAEHPVLAAIQTVARLQNIEMATRDDRVAPTRPTPILVRSAERRVEIETRDSGLYGNAFDRASSQAVRDATRIIDPPTVSHILAIEAPEPNVGSYKEEDIRYILEAAYAGFMAAIGENRFTHGPEATTSIHTGFWGCGAFGGNRTLILLLQMLAARLSHLDELVIHVGQPSAMVHFEEAANLLRQWTENETVKIDRVIDDIVKKRFQWGVSDGN